MGLVLRIHPSLQVLPPITRRTGDLAIWREVREMRIRRLRLGGLAERLRATEGQAFVHVLVCGFSHFERRVANCVKTSIFDA